MSLETSLSQPLDLQVKKGGSTLGYLLHVMHSTQAAQGAGTADGLSSLPQEGFFQE